MNIRKMNNEVDYATDSIVTIERKIVDSLKGKAAKNKRKRMRLCAHKSTEDSLHEMFIVLHKDAYIRPHKHVGKAESFHIVEGRVDVILFDDKGMVNKIIHMDEYASGKTFYYRIDAFVYHTLIVRSDVLVFHETTTGPFNREDSDFASWSPKESDFLAQKKFMAQLETDIVNFSHKGIVSCNKN